MNAQEIIEYQKSKIELITLMINNKDNEISILTMNNEKLQKENDELKKQINEIPTLEVSETRPKNIVIVEDVEEEKTKKNQGRIPKGHLPKFTCVCGKTINIHDKARHNRTKFHCKYIEQNTTTEPEPTPKIRNDYSFMMDGKIRKLTSPMDKALYKIALETQKEWELMEGPEENKKLCISFNGYFTQDDFKNLIRLTMIEPKEIGGYSLLRLTRGTTYNRGGGEHWGSIRLYQDGGCNPKYGFNIDDENKTVQVWHT